MRNAIASVSESILGDRTGIPRHSAKSFVKMSDQAIVEKNLGNEAYKKKDFAAAHQHYDKAIELDPASIVFLSNKAAVYFEQGLYEDCIKQCEKAIEVGRAHRADYTLISKAYARMANASIKLGKLKEALTFFEKSLSEHRDPEVLKKYKQTQKDLMEKEKLEYLNPKLSEEEKALGNEHFRNGKYPEALKHYTEAIKRNPDNGVLYSNRAACYIKLAEFEKAVTDCDACLGKDDQNVKAYIRKGSALQGLHKYPQAIKAYRSALNIDGNNREAMEGIRACNSKNEDAPAKQALEDPEVQKVLSDPVIKVVLEQMQQDPKAAQEHLKNPDICEKFMKLVEAGIVRLG
uniref:Stress-induced-phosphoprotein 1 n=1 Tax=Ditylenchus dipsaci TaxID=166011 RepID=A0A915ELG7_9BILA